MTDLVTARGHLEVGDGHRLYWEDWGNPDGAPVMFLHGGPGAGFHDGHKAVFDEKIHRVLFFDQRGSGKSTPFAGTEGNTTDKLIADIELLRAQAGFESMHVVGGSWGSALALLYAIRHPERVKSLLIWSVYLVRQFENDWVNEGYPRYHFPAEWERFISFVPEAQRKDGTSIMKYYLDKMRSADEAEAASHAVEWTLWESVLLSIDYDPSTLEAGIRGDPRTLSVALLETHYFSAGCFVPENYILENIDRITHIPCSVVQGRFDMCTPAISAFDLQRSYGDRLHLRWVNSGHLRSDPEMLAALQEAAVRELR
jgi:proline iminopeptidase